MILPKIKEAFRNSSFYKNYSNLPEDVLNEYKDIKIHYNESKIKLRKEMEHKLFNFVRNFIIFNVEDKYLEDYVLYLIEEFTFEEINKKILKLNDDILIDKIYNLDAIKLLIDNTIENEEFIYKNCSPEYYIKNNLDKNKLKFNKRMNEFFKKLGIRNKILKEKLNLDYNVDSYLNRFQNLNSALSYSMKSNNARYVKKLIRWGFDFDKNFVFKWGVENSQFKIVEILIKNGVDIHKDDDESLIFSCKHGNIRLAKLLIENGANVNAKNGEPLFHSCKNGNIEIVKLLIENGANIHDNNEQSLKISCEYNHIELVKLLIENGANIHYNNEQSLKISCINNHIEIIKLLIKNKADIHANNNVVLRFSCKYGNIELVKFLIKNGANIHENDEEALRFSCAKGHTEIVKILIEHGANIHVRWDEALSISYRRNHMEVVKILLKSDINYFKNNYLAKRIVKTRNLKYLFD